MKVTQIILLLANITACSQPNKEQPADETTPQLVRSTNREIISFLGKPLPRKKLSDSIRLVLENNLAIAKQRLEANPDSLNLIIWHGRRTAYLGRYFEAIEIYSKGLEQFPNSYRLYRHRGHRFISTRQLNNAIVDFERANELSMEAPNAIEPDGIPNRLNKPLGNDKFNIYYHQGLAYYLKGEFEKAISVYQQCMKVSDNDDLLAATSYWLFMTYHRIGEVEEAAKLLDNINDQLEIIENDGYRDLLPLFKGEKPVDALLAQAENASGVSSPTQMYGIGNWYLQQGDSAKAQGIWRGVVEGKTWDAFGYIVAEAEVANSTSTP